MTKYLETQGNKICGYDQCAYMGTFYTVDKHGGPFTKKCILWQCFWGGALWFEKLEYSITQDKIDCPMKECLWVRILIQLNIF